MAVQQVAGNDKKSTGSTNRQKRADENARSHGSGLKAGRHMLNPLVTQHEHLSGKQSENPYYREKNVESAHRVPCLLTQITSMLCQKRPKSAEVKRHGRSVTVCHCTVRAKMARLNQRVTPHTLSAQRQG